MEINFESGRQGFELAAIKPVIFVIIVVGFLFYSSFFYYYFYCYCRCNVFRLYINFIFFYYFIFNFYLYINKCSFFTLSLCSETDFLKITQTQIYICINN